MKRRLHSEHLVLIQLATFRSTLVCAMRCQHEQTQERSNVKRMLNWKLGSHKLRSTRSEWHCVPCALKHPVSHTSPVGQQIVLMFKWLVWKPSLTLCVVWPLGEVVTSSAGYSHWCQLEGSSNRRRLDLLRQLWVANKHTQSVSHSRTLALRMQGCTACIAFSKACAQTLGVQCDVKCWLMRIS